MKTIENKAATQFPDDLREWLSDSDLLLQVLDRLTDTCLPRLEDEEAQKQWSVGFSTFLTWSVYGSLCGYFGTETLRNAFEKESLLRYITLGRCPSAQEIRKFRRQYRPLLARILASCLESIYSRRTLRTLPPNCDLGAEEAELRLNRSALQDMAEQDH